MQEWGYDGVGQYVWSATNGDKLYLLDYAKYLKKENDVLMEKLKAIRNELDKN